MQRGVSFGLLVVDLQKSAEISCSHEDAKLDQNAAGAAGLGHEG